MMEKLFVVIPAYNEEENIEHCVNEWYSELSKTLGSESDFRLVIIDDGSKDSTYEKLKKLAEDYSLLIPLSKANGGHGAAVLYGYRYAINNGADWIFQTDSDGQTNPSEFSQFWQNRNNYDAILGNRIVRGDGKIRKFVENIVCLMIYIIFGVKVSDANAPFRLMKAELVSRYINKLPRDFNIPNIMFTAYFLYFHESVMFIPITFKPRVKGSNSINFRKIIKIGWRALWDFVKLRREINV